MDREQIKSERIVERYLSGDLTMRGAREFEHFCREHPEVLESLPIPARIKAQLTVKAFDGMGTSVFTARQVDGDLTDIAAVTGLKVVNPKDKKDEDEDDEPSPAYHGGLSRWWLLPLLLLLGACGYLLWQNQLQHTEIRKLGVAAKALALRAPGEMRTYRLLPTPAPSEQPLAAISLTQAQWLDLHLDVSTSRFKVFLITIEKTDENVRIMDLRRVAADTNQELRFALNSAAFPAGDYEIKLQGLDYRGQPHDDGWVLLRLQ